MAKQTETETTTTETKAEKFVRLVNPRVNKLIDQIRIVGNLSNRAGYDYDAQQVERIFNAIESALEESKAKYLKGLGATASKSNFDING